MHPIIIRAALTATIVLSSLERIAAGPASVPAPTQSAGVEPAGYTIVKTPVTIYGGYMAKQPIAAGAGGLPPTYSWAIWSAKPAYCPGDQGAAPIYTVKTDHDGSKTPVPRTKIGFDVPVDKPEPQGVGCVYTPSENGGTLDCGRDPDPTSAKCKLADPATNLHDCDEEKVGDNEWVHKWVYASFTCDIVINTYIP